MIPILVGKSNFSSAHVESEERVGIIIFVSNRIRRFRHTPFFLLFFAATTAAAAAAAATAATAATAAAFFLSLSLSKHEDLCRRSFLPHGWKFFFLIVTKHLQ